MSPQAGSLFKIFLFKIFMRKQKLVEDNIYHIYNRGVEKRLIFMDEHDYSRFIKNLAIFNDSRSADNFSDSDIDQRIKERKLLVDVLAFCLMPNHYHLLLRPLSENGITEFMRKLGTGYANYFNIKYKKRVGPLFQGKFKSVLISNEAQFIYIPCYIHLNPLGLIMPHWREKGVKNKKQALSFIDNYRWSSHADYRGESCYPFILNKSILNEYFGSEDNYSQYIYESVSNFDFSDVSDFLLE